MPRPKKKPEIRELEPVIMTTATTSDGPLVPAPPSLMGTVLSISPRWERCKTSDGRAVILDLDRVSAVVEGYETRYSVVFVNGGSVIVAVPYAQMLAKIGVST